MSISLHDNSIIIMVNNYNASVMTIHHRVSIMYGFIYVDCIQEILNYEPDL